MTAWQFHTYIHPETIVNVQNLAFHASFENYFTELTSNVDIILKNIEEIKTRNKNCTRYRYYINIPQDKNEIKHTYDQYYVFYKDRFLTNKSFHKRLVDFFSVHGLFVKEPIMRRSGVWLIDLLWK